MNSRSLPGGPPVGGQQHQWVVGGDDAVLGLDQHQPLAEILRHGGQHGLVDQHAGPFHRRHHGRIAGRGGVVVEVGLNVSMLNRRGWIQLSGIR
jgi:hypothetical protein